MKLKYLALFLISFISAHYVAGQFAWRQQYFDGADTSKENSVLINTSNQDTWQIGQPKKLRFNSANSNPNAIVTDTINTYATNLSASFSYSIYPKDYEVLYIVAIEWIQKLDFEKNKDGGLLEFSTDGGSTWNNALDNPYVYNFYGHDENSIDTLENGTLCYTGIDTNWRNIWLCFDVSWAQEVDSIIIRHTIVSDENDSKQDGWMIDNLLVHPTIVHTINEKKLDSYMQVHPNPSSGRINIETQKQDSYHIIEKIQLINLDGKTVEKWENCPTKFWIDTSNHPKGIYLLKVTTNIKTETFKIILE